MPKEFDDCVKKVMAQGKTKSEAFAICTATFKKAGKPTQEKMEDKEKKFDEEGREIIGENVKIFLEGGINSIVE